MQCYGRRDAQASEWEGRGRYLNGVRIGRQRDAQLLRTRTCPSDILSVRYVCCQCYHSGFAVVGGKSAQIHFDACAHSDAFAKLLLDFGK
jgi:hypothetical protein